MIDSLNLIIRLKYLDYRYLESLGIKPKFFSAEEISFNYKYIEFKYNSVWHYLLIMANPHSVLGKVDICLSDKENYKKKIYKIIREILPTQNISILVDRIDYCVDIPTYLQTQEYCLLLNRHRSGYHYMKQRAEYPTSMYLTNQTGQTHFNLYSRCAKTKDIKDLGILRLEVQNHPAKIRSEYRKDKDIKYKTIDYYWSIEAMEKYFFEFLKPYLYEGDYYKRDKCKSLVDSSNRTKKEKKQLNKLSSMESKYGIDALVPRKVFAPCTLKKYIDILNEMDINPITIPKSFEDEHLCNLLKLAREIAEEKYFK